MNCGRKIVQGIANLLSYCCGFDLQLRRRRWGGALFWGFSNAVPSGGAQDAPAGHGDELVVHVPGVEPPENTWPAGSPQGFYNFPHGHHPCSCNLHVDIGVHKVQREHAHQEHWRHVGAWCCSSRECCCGVDCLLRCTKKWSVLSGVSRYQKKSGHQKKI